MINNVKNNFKSNSKSNVTIVKFFLYLSLLLVTTAQAAQFNVLLFTKTTGWHHKSINKSISAFEKMSEQYNFDFEWHEDATRFNDKNLEKFDAIVFLLTTGDILNDAQQKSMERFIQSGKGFVGIHSASDTEYDWAWYKKLVGRSFIIHPVIQTAKLQVLQPDFPGLARMPQHFLWTDEWYEFGEEHIEGLKYILSVDEKTFSPIADWGRVKGSGMGEFHPIAWYHQFDGGRSFYTGLGHIGESYNDQFMKDHLFGGLYWAATGKGL